MEEELAKHLKQLADQFHGLAPVKCRELAFEYAEKNNIPVPANLTEKQCAEKPGHPFLARGGNSHALIFTAPERIGGPRERWRACSSDTGRLEMAAAALALETAATAKAQAHGSFKAPFQP
ncbi:unnamed protein product [Pleuronectes platessa]|uniref:Uncharacterized protein n=1 Tax=Pleuronectes platessa TaxID=8262 RepID=A0A9N7YV31_PLEPL|nr:unnamed protein product [Pleuronectes platessa]